MDFNCDNCGQASRSSKSEYARKKRHFCSRVCYSRYREESLPQEEQHAWKGGVTPEESRRKWAAKNKKVLVARARARRIREANAPGSHTRKEWEEVKAQGCVDADDGTCKGDITKDHEVPILMGGSNDISNIVARCRSHNSRKRAKVGV